MTEHTSLRFQAAVHSLQVKDDDRLATFYLMNISQNLNKWGVTQAALNICLPDLLGKPIGAGKGYVLGHQNITGLENEDYGEFVDVEDHGGYAMARARIDDDHVWALLSSGEWGPISVVIDAHESSCSLCGEKLKMPDNPFLNHAHIRDGDGYLLVHNFTFVRVDFVPKAAYPQARKIGLAEYETGVVPLQLLAAYYNGTLISNTGGGPGSPGVNQKPDEGKAMELEQLQAQNVELDKTVKSLETELQGLKAAKEDLEKKLETASDSTEVDALKKKFEDLEAERHQDILGRTLKARFNAGLSKDEKKDEEEIKDFSDEVLTHMGAEASALEVALMKEKDRVRPPRTRYNSDDADPLTAAMNKMRDNLALVSQAVEESA